jgi:DNA-binding protein H-NS
MKKKQNVTRFPERTEKLNKLRQLMLDDGIDPSELLEFSTGQTKPKKSVQHDRPNTSTR